VASNGTFSLVGHRTYTNVPKQNFMNSFRFSREKVQIITCESRVQALQKVRKGMAVRRVFRQLLKTHRDIADVVSQFVLDTGSSDWKSSVTNSLQPCTTDDQYAMTRLSEEYYLKDRRKSTAVWMTNSVPGLVPG